MKLAARCCWLISRARTFLFNFEVDLRRFASNYRLLLLLYCQRSQQAARCLRMDYLCFTRQQISRCSVAPAMKLLQVSRSARFTSSFRLLTKVSRENDNGTARWPHYTRMAVCQIHHSANGRHFQMRMSKVSKQASRGEETRMSQSS